MSTIFISFPPAAGGNHLRNIIELTTNLFNTASYRQSILDQYTTLSKIYVHGDDYASQIEGNIHALKIHRAVLNPSDNWLFYGHFSEIYSFRNSIAPIRDKKFILISPDSIECRNIWLARATKLNMQPVGDYYIGEQVFLYEPFIYYDMLKTKKTNVMNISVSEWFKHDVEPVFTKIELFLNTKIDRTLANQLHTIWINKQTCINNRYHQ